MVVNSSSFPIILTCLLFLSLCCNIYFIQNDNSNRYNNIVNDFDTFQFQSWLNYTNPSSSSLRNNGGNNYNKTSTNIGRSKIDELQIPSQSNINNKFRILHVVTSLTQYDDGGRGTTKQNDRLKNIIIPALQKTLNTVSNISNWEIDVYLILGYRLTEGRKQLIKDAIPEGVGLEIWERAIPYYGALKFEKPRNTIREMQHSLARQHRFVIKDKYDYYDFFSCWEDDMIITSHHIQTYLDMSNELLRLAKLAPGKNPQGSKENANFSSPHLIKSDFWRILPGFLRVEVLLQPEKYPKILPKNETIVQMNNSINSMSCCDVPKEQSTSIASWETHIDGIHLLHIPNSSLLNYVALLPCRIGNRYPIYPKREFDQHNPQLFAQQAGWFLTKTQLEFIDRGCPKGGFLPPYEEPNWIDNALNLFAQNVEFWSGGYHLFFRCGIQRILSLDPDVFSNQLLFHSSNNKQVQIENKRFTRADDLLGQIHTLKMRALHEEGLE